MASEITLTELRELLKAYGFHDKAKLPKDKLIDWFYSDDSDVERDIIFGG